MQINLSKAAIDTWMHNLTLYKPLAKGALASHPIWALKSWNPLLAFLGISYCHRDCLLYSTNISYHSPFLKISLQGAPKRTWTWDLQLHLRRISVSVTNSPKSHSLLDNAQYNFMHHSGHSLKYSPNLFQLSRPLGSSLWTCLAPSLKIGGKF